MLLQHGYTKNQKHKILMMNALRKRQEKEYLSLSILFNTLKLQYVSSEYKKQLFDEVQEQFKTFYEIISGTDSNVMTQDKKIDFSDVEISNAAKNIMNMLKNRDER
jgi:hypothetical protein